MHLHCNIGTGQHLAQLHDNYMLTVMMVTMMMISSIHGRPFTNRA